MKEFVWDGSSIMSNYLSGFEFYQNEQEVPTPDLILEFSAANNILEIEYFIWDENTEKHVFFYNDFFNFEHLTQMNSIINNLIDTMFEQFNNTISVRLNCNSMMELYIHTMLYNVRDDIDLIAKENNENEGNT